MTRDLHRLAFDWQPAPGITPPGTTLFAIGDVHGCLDQLDAMLKLVAERALELRASGKNAELVLLGDYVDRGPSSLGVLRRIGKVEAELGIPVHKLIGNHDLALREAVRQEPHAGAIDDWLWMGGPTMLAELELPMPRASRRALAEFAATLRERVGAEIRTVLDSLQPLHRAGDYLFVHGGVDPTQPVDEHQLDELVWMREPFLTGDGWSHPFVVVHGHTVLPQQVLPHRIATDSGCHATGVLTAVELSDNLVRYHMVAADPTLAAYRDTFGRLPG